MIRVRELPGVDASSGPLPGPSNPNPTTMRTTRPLALLLLALLAAGCDDDVAPTEDRETAEVAPAAEPREEEEPEFEPLDGHFTVDTARVPGTAP